jgi:hypothetical protein
MLVLVLLVFFALSCSCCCLIVIAVTLSSRLSSLGSISPLPLPATVEAGKCSLDV